LSGFTSIAGFAPPTTLPNFLSLLQTASFRGVPFKVRAARVKKGRRWAIHESPCVDGGRPEDMGRALRAYSFSGSLIGDLAPVMQLLLDNAIEAQGPGLQMHPTIGALQVGLLSSSTAVHWDKLRVIEVAFEFIEVGAATFALTVIATVVSVLAVADSALTSCGTNFALVATPAAAASPSVLAEAQTVATRFAAEVSAGGPIQRRSSAWRRRYLRRTPRRPMGAMAPGPPRRCCRPGPPWRRCRRDSPITAPLWRWRPPRPPQPRRRIPPPPICWAL
jgi:hypothetical protein